MANWVMVPNQEAYKSNLWHVKSKDERLLPHRIEPWERKIKEGEYKIEWIYAAIIKGRKDWRCQKVHIHLPFSLQQNYLLDLHNPGKIGHLTEIACLRVTELLKPARVFLHLNNILLDLSIVFDSRSIVLLGQKF